MNLIEQIKSNRNWMASQIREIRNDMRKAAVEAGVSKDRMVTMMFKANLIATRQLKLDEPKDLYTMRPTLKNLSKARETLQSNIEWYKNGLDWDRLGCGEQDHLAEKQNEMEKALRDIELHLGTV